MTIDLSRYHGHSEGPWTIKATGVGADHDIYDGSGKLIAFGVIGEANARLMADAVSLIAEVERLKRSGEGR